MSITVEVDELPAVLAELDAAAYVCTADNHGRSKVIHALIKVADGELLAAVGRGTVANVRAGSAVTLVIPGSTPADMSLLIDANAEPVGDADVVMRATAAVWHRSAHGAGQ